MGIKLNERAMLVTLSISQWTARKHDRRVSREVDKTYGTQNAGRYHKSLLTGQYKDKLKEIQTKVNVIRSYHYDHTLPWLDSGARILTAKSFQHYHLTMTKEVEEFKDLVKEFASLYNVAVLQARDDLNSLFNGKDYPQNSQDLMKRFSVSISFSPLPDSEDFRVSLSDDIVQAIKEDIDRSTTQAQKVLMSDLWERLYKPVAHMAQTLQDDTKVFRDTLVGNLIEICKILPDLNITENMDLEKKRSEIEKELCRFGPDTLRNDFDARADIAKKAQQIAESMRGYIGNDSTGSISNTS